MKNLTSNEIAIILEVMQRAVAKGELHESWLSGVERKLDPKPAPLMEELLGNGIREAQNALQKV